LTKTHNGCEARLRDNGEGFDIGATEGSTHYGIKGMRERIHKIGGELDLQTAPGKGTEIKITIPFKRH
jgi:signal transduction histidine kinase